MNPSDPNSSDRPVAYDAEGKPLYAAPQPSVSPNTPSHVTRMPEAHEGHNFDPRMRAQYGNEPDVVHHPRAYEPAVATVSEELKRKHERSTKLYPHLNLSEGEFVILDIKRHPIGLFIPMSITIGLIIMLVAGLGLYPGFAAANAVNGEVPGLVEMTVIILCLIVIIGIGGYIAVWVYLRNAFYMTNESVIQEIQLSLFSKREQTVSLGSIEDASFRQNGILQTLLNYGTIRLSTEGEETTYRFQYVADPRSQIATLNNAIESFKNGRPVLDDDEN